MVSVCCVVFNHRDYIGEALDSFVKQETNFKFEVLVHDDASTDGSSEVISAYARRYPDIVKPILQSENQWMRNTRNPLIHELFPRARGKYIALCEGDDYWTEKDKLKIQVEFLETCPEYSICFHNTFQGHVVEKSRLYSFDSDNEVSLIDAFNHPIGHTSSLVFRRELGFPKALIEKTNIGDWPLKLHMLMRGKGFYFSKPMSFYRIHGTSVYGANHALRQIMTSIETYPLFLQEYGYSSAIKLKSKLRIHT